MEMYRKCRPVTRNLCPVGARVSELVGIRKKGGYKCAWRVRYLRDGHENIDAQLLDHEILNVHPQNTEIVSKSRTFPPGLEFDYSIRCRCSVQTPVWLLKEVFLLKKLRLSWLI